MQVVDVPIVKLLLVAVANSAWPQRVTVRKKSDASVFMQAEGVGEGQEFFRNSFVLFNPESFIVTIEHRVNGAGPWLQSSDRKILGGGDPWTLFTVQADDGLGDFDFNDSLVYFNQSAV